MARGRMISQTISYDPEFNGLSMEAKLAYMLTIPHLDRDGLIHGEPVVLWGRVAPLTQELMPKMLDAIQEWENSGLVIWYESKMGRVLFFKGFAKNQTGMRYDRESESMFPCPPGYTRTDRGLEPIGNGGGRNPAHPEAPNQDGDGPEASNYGEQTPPEPEDSSEQTPPHVLVECELTPAELRQNSGRTSGVRRDEVEVEVKGEGEDQHARTHEETRNASSAAVQPSPPPSILQPGQRLFRDARPARDVERQKGHGGARLPRGESEDPNRNYQFAETATGV